MIQHSVIFKLRFPENTPETEQFWQAARGLATIPGVSNFQCLKQTSPKNQFEFGLSMEFVDQQTYDAYSVHPDHEAFIQNFWLKQVYDFLEIDFERM